MIRVVAVFAMLALIVAMSVNDARADEIDMLAAVLRLEDSRAPAAKLAEYAFPDKPREVRLRALMALGNNGDPAACDILLLYLNDEDESIARTAITATGMLWFPNALAPLNNPPDGRALDELGRMLSPAFTPKARSHAESIRAEAVRAFGKIAQEGGAAALVPFLKDALAASPDEHRSESAKAALVAIFRAKPPGARDVAAQALSHFDPEVRADAALALGRLGEANSVPILEKALLDPDGRVRASAARAVGRLGGTSKPDLLLPLLNSAVREELISGFAAYGKSVNGIPLERAISILQTAQDENVTPVHLAVLDALGRRADDDAALLLEDQIKRKGAIRIRAVQALGQAHAGNALLRIDPVSLTGDHLAAAAWVDALAACDLQPTRDRLGELLDMPARPAPYRDDPRGVVALVGACSAAKVPAFMRRIRDFLASDDDLVRSIACDYVTEKPDVVLLDPVLTSLAASSKLITSDGALSALGALGKIGEKFAKGSFALRKITDAIEPLLADPRYSVRWKAAEVIFKLKGARHPEVFFGIDTGRTPEFYLAAARDLTKVNRYQVRTNRGDFILEVPFAFAPLTARRFEELVRTDFYKGTVVHRVEPNFVMQTGDPVGTGYGGSGVPIRDELERMPFGAHILGLATAGKDTGDSQWFVTHINMPHLDGSYTAFGRVLEGGNVVDDLVHGDVVLSIVEQKPVEH